MHRQHSGIGSQLQGRLRTYAAAVSIAHWRFSLGTTAHATLIAVLLTDRRGTGTASALGLGCCRGRRNTGLRALGCGSRLYRHRGRNRSARCLGSRGHPRGGGLWRAPHPRRSHDSWCSRRSHACSTRFWRWRGCGGIAAIQRDLFRWRALRRARRRPCNGCGLISTKLFAIARHPRHPVHIAIYTGANIHAAAAINELSSLIGGRRKLCWRADRSQGLRLNSRRLDGNSGRTRYDGKCDNSC